MPASTQTHGGLLTTLTTVEWKEDHSPEALVSLVQRQHRLEQVEIRQPDALPALFDEHLAEGSLHHVRELTLAMVSSEPMIYGDWHALAGALQGGVLPALD